MNTKLSPVAAAKRVLRAFPFPKAGAVVSQRVIEEYFRLRSLPMATMDLGVQYAIQAGWMQQGELKTLMLLEAGMNEIAKPALIAARPQSVWHSWAHG